MAGLTAYLTNEERSFLQQLFHDAAADRCTSNSRGEVEFEAVGSEGRRLLDLLCRMDVVLQAEDSRQRLQFKLSVVPSPFGGPGRLKVSAPLVSERRRTAVREKAAGADSLAGAHK